MSLDEEAIFVPVSCNMLVACNLALTKPLLNLSMVVVEQDDGGKEEEDDQLCATG